MGDIRTRLLFLNPDFISADANYVHTQNTPSKIWNVTHNLNKRCSIQVVDSNFREIVAKVVWLNNNQVQVEFNLNFTGYVYCN